MSDSPCEELAPHFLRPARDEMLLEPAPVHVWLWRTDYDESRCAEMAPLLPPVERAAAARFRFPVDRARALVSHGGLRLLLAAYLNAPPESILFAAGDRGKPRLACPDALSFNLSHSGAYAVAAFSRGRELGIDIERIRPETDWQGIAARFFSADERAWLDSEASPEAFFRLWTAKEAVLKAGGMGLSVPLDRFTVRPGEDAPPWNLRELHLVPGYAAAVAFDGPPAVPVVR